MRSPFKFLDAYTVEDQHVFFGRDSEKEALYNLVFKTNLLIVYGLSGTGKTSLIQCGLASMFDGPDWYPMFIRRNDNLNDSVRSAMKMALGGELKDDLVEDVKYLVRKTLRPVYLIFDQFEELFVLGSEEEQQTFIDDIRKVLEAGLNAKVLLVMREEYIGALYPFEEDIPNLFDFRFRVEPMGITKVKSVIQESYAKFNISLEEPVEESLQLMVEQITDPKAGIALPYLQVYLDMLWRVTYRKQYGKDDDSDALPHLDIRQEDIKGLGRIDNVLEKFMLQQSRELNSVLRSEYPTFPPNGIQLLLDPFATEDGTKRPVHYEREGETIVLDPALRKSLPEFPGDSMTRAIELLDQARILRVKEDTMELAHDSLAAIIDQRRTDEQRQLQELRRRLTNAYEEFEKTNVYLNGKQLAAFEEYLPKLQLSNELVQFIQKSEEHVRQEAEIAQKREQQEQEAKHHKKLARVRGWLLILVGIFAVVAVILFIMALYYIGVDKEKEVTLQQQNILLNSQNANISKQYTDLQNVIKQVKQQAQTLSDLMKEDPNSVKDYRSKLEMSLLALRSIVVDDSTGYGKTSMPEIVLTTAAGLNDRNLPEDIGEQFRPGQSVYLYARVPADTANQLLQVKWFVNNDIAGDPNFITLNVQDDDSVGTITLYRICKVPGDYQAKLYNVMGAELGRAQFEVTGEKLNTTTEIRSAEDFRIVGIISNGVPGEDKTRFRPGQRVYYWGQVRCSADQDDVTIEIIPPAGEIWTHKHTLEYNMGDGYTVWNWKTFYTKGTYTVRVLDSHGNNMINERQFVIE